jgi:predicted PurR-regulated permease PerM
MLIIIVSFLAITVPVFLLSFLLYSKISAAFNSPESILNIIHLIDEKVNALTGYDILSDDTINVLKSKAGNLIPDLLGKVFDILAQVLICYFLLFYMLFYYKEIPAWIEKYLPLGAENTAKFMKELESMTMSNVIGSPLLALIQSAAAIIGFYLFGVDEALFWGFMCGFLSFVPFIGSALVYIPIGILMLSLGKQWQGIATLVYGIVVIGNIDNVMRFVIQKKFADVHPLITVFGVIIGLQLFGLPGLIFGPLMISYFILGVKIYRTKYVEEI